MAAAVPARSRSSSVPMTLLEKLNPNAEAENNEKDDDR
jgi:hypothetical protein